MRIDPELSHLKFQREVERLKEQRADLEGRCIFVLGEPAYPVIELLYVPRNLVRVLVQQAGAILLPQGRAAAVEMPTLTARAFKARFDLGDFDLRAPSLEFLDPWTNAPLPYAQMFRALEFEPQRGQHVVLLDDHPVTHKPFLCIRGIREYHEHPQHSGDDWLLYRRDMSLFSIILAVWRVCIDLIRPTILPGGMQVNWAADEKA